MNAAQRPSAPTAFSLVELLVVIGVISILVVLLLPMLARAKQQAQLVACKSNLQQIATATRLYANLFDDKYPDSYTLGGAPFRRGPGEKDAEPYAAAEVYGLPSLYQDLNLINPAGGVWICPAATEKMRAYKNTYIWATMSGLPASYRTKQRGRPQSQETFWVYDNFANEPYTSGARRGGSLPVLPAYDWLFPHRFRGRVIVGREQGGTSGGSNRRGAINVLFLDGHVGMALYVTDPTKPPGSAPKTVILRGE